MKYFFNNQNSSDLILFFSGWGCDENQFTNLKDDKDVLILYDYHDLNLDFQFDKYSNIYVVAYSAGVFVASVLADKINNIRKKVAVCGNPYLFDEKLGIPPEIIKVFKNITLDNYLDFRKHYMVFGDEEYEQYNKLQSLRTIESCEEELEALKKIYNEKKMQINPVFDAAVAAENDLIFNLSEQKMFYKEKLSIIKNARHHIFFRFKSFEEIINGVKAEK